MLGRRFLLIVLNNAVGGITGVLSLFFITRYMGNLDALGMFAYGLSLAGTASFLMGLGFDAAHVKRISEGRPIGDAVATYVRIKLALLVLFVVLTLSAAVLWQRYVGYAQHITTSVIVLAVVYHAFLQLRSIPGHTFNAILETGKSQIIGLVEHVTKMPLLILAAMIFAGATGSFPTPETLRRFGRALGVVNTDESGALLLAGAHVVAMGASFIVAFWLLRRSRFPPGRFDATLARGYATFALPLALFAVLQPLATQLDTAMVGYFYGTKEVTDYFFAQRITTFTFVIPTAVGTLFFPRLSELVGRGAHEEAHAFTLRTQQILSQIIWLPTILALAFSVEGTHLFNDRLRDAAPILVLLSLNVAVLSYATVSSSVLLAHGRSHGVALISGVVVVTNIVLNVLFIAPAFLDLAGLGAAMATVTAQVVGLLVAVYLGLRVTGRLPFGTFVPKHLLAAGLTVALLFAIKPLPWLGGLDRWYELSAAALVGLAAYLLLLTLFGELGRKEWSHAADLLHPGRLVRYVWDEIRADRR